MTARSVLARRNVPALLRLRALAILACCTLGAASVAEASPGITKKGGDSPPKTSAPSTSSSSSSSSRNAAIAKLKDGEALVQAENVGDGLIKMLEAYQELEKIDGADAKGVKELRSWLVKALETAGLPDEAKQLRSRGAYVDHPLSVMPSTWFASTSSSSSSMGVDEALAATEKGLTMLTEGNVEGLGLVLEAYEIVEREKGAESEDAIVLRSFMVGLLETGGFTDEAASLRSRGSVKPPTEDEKAVYVATWAKIIEAEGNAGVSQGSVDSSSLKNGSWSDSSSSGSGSGSASSSDSSYYDSSDDDDDDDDKPKAFQKGSAVPAAELDFGLGQWASDVGPDGFIWTAGTMLDWNLFSVKIFSMGIDVNGLVGRNRDKRWLTDVGAHLSFTLSFGGKFYISPAGGGGYDGLTGKNGESYTDDDGFERETLRIAPAAYYDYGGRLGFHFGDGMGLYAQAFRVHRLDDDHPFETRGRLGFTLGADKAAFDLAAVLGLYEASDSTALGGGRLISGNVGFRF